MKDESYEIYKGYEERQEHYCSICRMHTDHQSYNCPSLYDYEPGGFSVSRKPSRKVSQAAKAKAMSMKHRRA